MARRFAAGVVLLSAAFLTAGSAFGEQTAGSQNAVVFRVGGFDRSSFEFGSGTPKKPVTFIVGQSNPAEDWYATQPAVFQSGAGETGADAASAPRAIQFSLDSTPHGAFRLHAALLIESSSVPALRIDINGRRGLLYLHPRLDYNNGDQGSSFYAAYSHADVVFDFPAHYLKKGKNRITFQAVEEARQTIPGASLTYDAVELDRIAYQHSFSSARIEPTVFFDQENGGSREEVDVFITSAGPLKAGAKVELNLNGKVYRQAAPGNQDLGDEKLVFSLPDFPSGTKAQLGWSAGTRKEHLEAAISPQKRWTIFLAPEIHLDVGYSDYQGKVAAIHSQNIDEALGMMERNPKFRYSLDGEWDLEQFFRTHTVADQERAIQAIRDHKLYVPAQYANLLTGFPTAETLIRSLYPSAEFSREHQAPFNYANITDVPSFSWSYASILASAGVHDLAAGSNNYRAPVLLQGRLNQSSPMWWEGPDGGKVLLWYSRHYMQMQFFFGLPQVADAGRDTLPLFLQMYEHPGYVGDETLMYGTQVENSDLFLQQAHLVEQWNKVYAYPHLEYSGFHHALQSIQQQFGSKIPTLQGDGGPYWEDGIASDASYAGMERWNEGLAPTAEKFATLTSIVNPRLRADKSALDRMWQNMVLMDEHTWDSSDSVSDPTSMEAVGQQAVKNQYAMRARGLADFITRNSMASLANAIPAGAGRVIVFNSLNWKQSKLVAMDLRKNSELLDTTSGEKVPFEVLSSGPDFNHIQFLATDVPAVGYKVYKTQPATAPAVTAPDHRLTMENAFYRIMLDPTTGAVKSIFDKQLQRELVNGKSPYRFGQYLYVTGGDKGPNTLLEYSHVYPRPELVVHPAEGGSLISVAHTPYGWVARMRSHDVNTPEIDTRIRLFDGSKKIEFIEDIQKKSVDTKEGIYFAFPFSMDHPQFQYEIQNGVVDPAKNMYPGAGHEWFSVQHWIALQQNGLSVALLPLDAALATLGDINRGAWPEQFGDRPGNVFSYIMNNYWDTNYRAGQGGHFEFHYVLTSASATNPAALSRLGWEEITPLEADTVTTQDKALTTSEEEERGSLLAVKMLAQSGAACVLNPHQGSFLDGSDPDLLFDTWKPAEDGDGSILRFLDLGGGPRTVWVRLPYLHLKAAWQTDSVERDEQQLPLSGDSGFRFMVHPHEIVSVRVVGTDVCEAK
ncbi:MAG: polysaccharide lyase family protein [Acidobacteriaceae bacterium]